MPEYDEIDIISYVRFLRKKLSFIISLFLIFIIIAAVYSYFIAEKVYKIDTILESSIKTGIEGSSRAIEEAMVLKNKIQEDVYGIYVRKKLGISEGEYISPTAYNPEKSNLITIEAKTSQPEKAKQILEETNNFILEESQEKAKLEKRAAEDNIKSTENDIISTERSIKLTENQIVRNENVIADEIARTRNKISALEEEKDNLEKKIEELEKVLVYEQTPGTQFALFDTKEKLAKKKQEIETFYIQLSSLIKNREDSKENLETQLKSLENHIVGLRTKIDYSKASLDEIKSIRLVKEPVISESPIKPRPMFNMVVAGALGVFTGIVLALGKEWWDKSKA